MDELYQRVSDCAERISSVSNRQARRDLLKMLGTVDSALTKLDCESVECRRLNKITARFETQKAHAEELMANLEKHLVFALLLYT